jgi:plastocyanin
VRSRALPVAALVAALSALVLGAVVRGEVPDPYVITAIDYHFHDAHPTFPIGPGRDVIVKNAGRNLHNVSIPALGYSEDVAPGGELVISDIADRFGSPGRYTLVCVIHQDRGMNGTLVIASE